MLKIAFICYLKKMKNKNLETYTIKLHQLHKKDQFRELKSMDENMINLSSNDYLGLASDENIQKEFLNLLKDKKSTFLFGSTSSRLLSGNYLLLTELENAISEAYGYNKETLLFNSGYHANSGIIPALIKRHDLILSDKLNHASIIDGCLLSRADFVRYKHLDYQHLDKILYEKADKYKKILVISESVFSMDGDLADLRKLVEIKKKYSQIILYIDEAHAIGVRGSSGLGFSEESETINHIDILVGTFGKAFASVGAYALLNNPLKDYLINSCRTLIYSTVLPPINTIFTKFIFHKLKSKKFENKRKYLKDLSNWFRRELQKVNIKCGANLETSNIIPIVIGSNTKTLKIANLLFKNGFICPAIRPPTVPQNSSRLRISLTTNIKKKDLLRFIEIVKEEL